MKTSGRVGSVAARSGVVDGRPAPLELHDRTARMAFLPASTTDAGGPLRLAARGSMYVAKPIATWSLCDALLRGVIALAVFSQVGANSYSAGTLGMDQAVSGALPFSKAVLVNDDSPYVYGSGSISKVRNFLGSQWSVHLDRLLTDIST